MIQKLMERTDWGLGALEKAHGVGWLPRTWNGYRNGRRMGI